MTVIGCAGEHRPWALRLVLFADRLVTWGMEPAARREVIAEQAADWEAMASDVSQSSSAKILFRLMRGLPSAIWWRVSGRDVTALPVAAALIFIASVSLVAVMATSAYPPNQRLSLSVLGCGLAIAAHHLIRRPRSLVAANYRVASLLVGIGGIATALTLPTPDNWTYDATTLTTPGIDLAMEISIVLISFGFLGVFVASLFEKRRRRVILGAGLVVVGGSLLLSVLELVWGIRASSTDLFLTAMALLYSFGAVLFAHMVLRLRHLDIS